MKELNELVELAKKSTPGRNPDRLESCGGGIKYQCLGDDGSLVLQCDHKNDEYGFIGPKSLEDEAFFLACNPDNILAIAEAFRELEHELKDASVCIEAAKQEIAELEAKLAELAKQKPVAYVHPAYLQAGALGFDASVGRLAPAQIPLFTRPAPAADLVLIGRVDRGEVSDNNEYPNARVVCLHDQADWENFPDGTELFLRPAPAAGMDKPEPYAWLVHAPQGDYVERNPEVVAHLEGTGLTKCKPLYLDL